MDPASDPDAAALLQAAPVALLHVGADGLLQRCNAAAQALCGPEATAGRPWAGLFSAGAGEALPTSAATAPAARRVALRRDPAIELDLGVQPLAAGGWMLALLPLRDPPAGRSIDAESLLTLAIELGGIAVWRHDLATDRVHYSCSASAFDAHGMAPRPEGLSLAELRALVHPDDLAQVLASVQRALVADGPTDIEARYHRAGGGWRHVLARSVLQRDAAGRPQAFVGVALDVTDHRAPQRHAEDMTRRFELATAAAGIGYWTLAQGATRATWSPALRALFELPPQAPVPTMTEWLNHHVHPDDREAVGRQFSAWSRGDRDSLALSLRILRPDGGLRYLSTHSLIERGDPQRWMFGVVVDLTERRSAELALRNAQERVALAARGAGLGTWELDLQSNEAFWDEQMWLLRGHPPQARAMDEAERLACLHPDDRAAMVAQLADALARGIPFENEFRVVWPDGQLRWLASRSAEVCDEHAGARRRIGVNWDVTDKRSAEAARREREMAQRESLAKSRFLARMSHELRTPLNAVIGFAQLLLSERGDSGAHEPARRRQVEHIHAAGEHLLALIDDVLDLSSLESGELRISLQPVALAPLLAQTLPMLETLRARHGVELQLGALPGAVMADTTRLRQVLLNLLSNAIKYSHGGGCVRVEAMPAGSELLIRVTDTGRGMSAEQLRHLYEPFNRLGRQSEGPDGVEGSGIGLTIVKALMERMGGSVQAQSTPGAGSVFELRLADATPAAAPAPAAMPVPVTGTAAPRRASANPRATLLYIEDNPVNALIVSELIARRVDLQLHIAPDGGSGVQRALELRPDLVLLDMQLPDFDGHEVLRRLRAHAELAEVPVIALSANAMPDDIERALRAGMADYWTKPLDFGAFMAALDRMFGEG